MIILTCIEFIIITHWYFYYVFNVSYVIGHDFKSQQSLLTSSYYELL